MILKSTGRLGLRVCSAKKIRRLEILCPAGRLVRPKKDPCARGAPGLAKWDDGRKVSELYICILLYI